jgi:hypothetical protein
MTMDRSMGRKTVEGCASTILAYAYAVRDGVTVVYGSYDLEGKFRGRYHRWLKELLHIKIVMTLFDSVPGHHSFKQLRAS